MEDLSTFIPMDRRQALAGGLGLPDRATGAALLTDLAGFTPLAETLATALGPQRGAEELTRVLERVYTALITQIDAYGGSVIGFSGDALTCWFDADDGARAATCALALQRSMPPIAALDLPEAAPRMLALKVAVAAGPVRRFLVGDPQVQVLDVLAGRTLERLAAAGQVARPGEVVLAPATARRLTSRLALGARRAGGVVVEALVAAAASAPWPGLPPGTLPSDQLRPWVLPAVWARLQPGLVPFLAELRPAVALFLHFAGLDYDRDPAAGARLDAYVRWVQEVLGAHDGSLIDLTIGDKGSYLYAAFGAPLAHADDAARAAAAAWELRVPPATCRFITQVQMGLSQGIVWVGACGGPTRRTYAVLGDAVNLGARLMQHAAPGQILASTAVREATGPGFAWTAYPPLRVKGKAAPVAVHALTGKQPRPLLTLLEPEYTSPLVGREEALAWLDSRLASAQAGQGQVAGIAGEAGLGKSRLLVEAMRRARAAGWIVYGGAARADGTQTPYVAWQMLWRGFFALDSRDPLDTQTARVGAALATIDPRLRERLPLLGPLLGLSLPDTPLTGAMDGALRQASLEALLVDCLRARAAQPLLLVLEDCHWLDPLSQDLLVAVARAIARTPVLLLLAYRPPEGDEPPVPPAEIAALPHFAELRLAPLALPAVTRLVAGQLRAMSGTGAATDDPPPGLVAQLAARAEGNPFYLEELLHYLADQSIVPGSAPWTEAAWEHLEWPTSLHRLLLARIDRLTEHQRTVLKVASIIGRRFRFSELWGVYPELGAPDQVQAALLVLDRVGLTPLDIGKPEPVYLFKHIVTQEVTYAALPYGLRGRLHEQFAGWLEAGAVAGVVPPLDLLAYHYGRSANEDKQREYYRKAGDAAMAAYANVTARSYYERLLPLVGLPERAEVLLALGTVLARLGAWDAAAARYEEAIVQTSAREDRRMLGHARTELGFVHRVQGRLAEAETCLTAACADCAAAGDDEGLSRALSNLGNLYEARNEYAEARAQLAASRVLCAANARQPWAGVALARVLWNLGKLELNQGRYGIGREILEECIALQRSQSDKRGLASTLNVLGYLTTNQGDPVAWKLWEESLALFREVGDRRGIASALAALGYQARMQGNLVTARGLYEESLAVFHEIGYRWGAALAINNLGYIAAAQDDPAHARALLAESLERFHAVGDKRLGADSLSGLALVAAGQGHHERAARFLGATARLLADSGGAFDPLERTAYEATVAATQTALGAEAFAAAWAVGESWSWDEAVVQARAG